MTERGAITSFADLDNQDTQHLDRIGSQMDRYSDQERGCGMNIAASAVHPLDPITNWPDLDMNVIKPERSPAPEMTEQEFALVFGEWARWLKSAAEVKSAHVDYVALALLSSASAAIGNARWAVPWDGWKEPPTLWGMLIGDPSAGKSPALDAVLDPIKEIDAELSRDYQKERTEWSDKDEVARLVLAQWKSDMKSALVDDSTPPEKPEGANAGTQPVRKRIRITDVTTEKVAELVQATWRGLLLSRDELSGWLGSMDRYSGGGDRPFWLEAFGGRSYTVDRKNSPERPIAAIRDCCGECLVRVLSRRLLTHLVLQLAIAKACLRSACQQDWFFDKGMGTRPKFL